MENFDFDNKFKEGLENINPMLNNDEIWNNIEPHLKKKKKRRLLIWFFFGAIGLLGLFWFLSDVPTKNDADTFSYKEDLLPENSGEKSRNDVSTSLAEDKKTSNIEPDNDKSKATILPEPDISKNEKRPQESPIVKSNSSSVSSPTNNTRENKPKVVEVDPSKPASIPTVEESKASVLPPEVNLPVEKKNLGVDQKEREAEKFTPALEPKTEVKQELEISIPKTTPSIPKIRENEVTESTTPKEPEVKKKLTKKEREQASKKRKEERKKAKKEREEKRKEEKKKAEEKRKAMTKPQKKPKWNYQFQMLGSGIYTLHSVNHDQLQENDYLINRKKYVTGTYGFGSELRFATESPSGLILTAGLQYQQLHEQLIRQETISESEVQEVLETVTEDATGKIISSTSSIQLVTTTTTYNQQFYSNYRFINIPIGVGYAFKYGKSRFKLLGGADLNTYFKFTGSMFDRQLNIVKMTSKHRNAYGEIFENTVGLGIWASLEWHKPISEKLSLVIAPGIQAPLGSITTNSEYWPYSHKLTKLKLGVGMNYTFGTTDTSKVRVR